jgi:hypothetical protein
MPGNRIVSRHDGCLVAWLMGGQLTVERHYAEELHDAVCASFGCSGLQRLA